MSTWVMDSSGFLSPSAAPTLKEVMELMDGVSFKNTCEFFNSQVGFRIELTSFSKVWFCHHPLEFIFGVFIYLLFSCVLEPGLLL